MKKLSRKFKKHMAKAIITLQMVYYNLDTIEYHVSKIIYVLNF